MREQVVWNKSAKVYESSSRTSRKENRVETVSTEPERSLSQIHTRINGKESGIEL